MVDYSKFDDIDTDSSSDSDTAAVQALQKNARLQSKSPDHHTFMYPLRDTCMGKFDIRENICKTFGYSHGDVVITKDGLVSTAIGVRMGKIWFHVEGSSGAGTFKDTTGLTVVGRVKVVHGGGEHDPSIDWLQLDFPYKRGVVDASVAMFDVRDDICKKVGGFLHGEVVTSPYFASLATTIGVRRKDVGVVKLWFHCSDSPGAGLFEPQVMKKLKVVGRDVVHPAQVNGPAAEQKMLGMTCPECNASRDAWQEAKKDKETLQSAIASLKKELKQSTKKDDAELKKLQKCNDRLRRSNQNLIKSRRQKGQVIVMTQENVDPTSGESLAGEDDIHRRIRMMERETVQLKGDLARHKIAEQERIRANEDESKRLQAELARRHREQKKLEEVETEAARLRAERESLTRKLDEQLPENTRLREELAVQKQRDKKRLGDLEKEASRLRAERAELTRKLSEKSPAANGNEETWQFECDGGWASYEPSVGHQLSGAFRRGLTMCKVSCAGKEYEVDFTLMKQMNCITNKRRTIRCCFGLPTHWKLTDEEALKSLRPQEDENDAISSVHSLLSLASAYTVFSNATRHAMVKPFKRHTVRITDKATLKQFEELLQKSVLRPDGSPCAEGCIHGTSKFRVTDAYHVENLYLWRRYRRFCQNMRDKHMQYGIEPEIVQANLVGPELHAFARRIQSDVNQNELVLFHGTPKFHHAQHIVIEGFDSRIAKQGLYGRGTYFASQSCKSAQYGCKGGTIQKANRRNQGTIMISRVALGDPFYTDRTLQACSRPPSKMKASGDDDEEEDEEEDEEVEEEQQIPCDSVIARPGTSHGWKTQLHAEFVIFAPEQAYPEYIVCYTED